MLTVLSKIILENIFINRNLMLHYYRWRRKWKWCHGNWRWRQCNSFIVCLWNYFWQISAASTLGKYLLVADFITTL